MSDTNQQQDHPGPEWVEIDGKFYCPGLGMEMSITIGDARPLAATRCRAISAAALAWERMKQAQQISCHYCGATSDAQHTVACPIQQMRAE